MLKSLDKLNFFFLIFYPNKFSYLEGWGFVLGCLCLFIWLAFGLCVYPFFTFAILEHEY